MTEQDTHGLPATAPKPLLEREIKLDLRQLGKALVGGGTDALKGDWYGAARRLGEGFIDGLGLAADDAGALAWRLVLTSLRRAVLGLVDEYRLLLLRRPENADALPDKIALVLEETELRVDERLPTESWKLPLLKALEPAFARWLWAFGVEKDSAEVIAARLPRRFGLALWDEWAAHPDTYRPLFDAVMAPIQRPPDLDDLRQRYLDYLSDSYRFRARYRARPGARVAGRPRRGADGPRRAGETGGGLRPRDRAGGGRGPGPFAHPARQPGRRHQPLCRLPGASARRPALADAGRLRLGPGRHHAVRRALDPRRGARHRPRAGDAEGHRQGGAGAGRAAGVHLRQPEDRAARRQPAARDHPRLDQAPGRDSAATPGGAV
ncbi:MAG: hypothetical protein LJE69_17285 [Thiohalocapsa sp.]|uniref:hypothetical protein n=1 Tax=Thiohalocapsa sp. TaxID=2497641 RepID=UPI0025DEFE50|nr:hypothetical protein [Thiohalocapsa sp.]MCG6942988.1 hypothetical protein [Thiohalocapsa sp.]